MEWYLFYVVRFDCLGLLGSLVNVFNVKHLQKENIEVRFTVFTLGRLIDYYKRTQNFLDTNFCCWSEWFCGKPATGFDTYFKLMVWLYKNVKKYLNFDIRKKYDWFHSWHHFPPYNNKVLFKVDINKKKNYNTKKMSFSNQLHTKYRSNQPLTLKIHVDI